MDWLTYVPSQQAGSGDMASSHGVGNHGNVGSHPGNHGNQDGFLSSILGEEDLHLMDMAISDCEWGESPYLRG